IDTTTLSLSAASNVVEGSGSLTYTATLSNAAQGAVTVHLDNGQTITIADGDTQGTTTVAVRADDPYLDQSTLTAAITTATGGNFENLSIDTTTHTTTVDDTIDTTTLSLSAASNVVEGSGSLTYTATLSNAAQGAVTVHLDNGQTITIADGDTQGTTTVAVRADDPYLDQSTLTAAITTATGGNFENLSIDTTTHTTTVDDTIDTTTLSLSAASNVVEGSGSLTYTATLSNAAQGAVTVHLDNGQTITIADGDTQGTTTVAVRADDPYLDQSTLTAAITTATGGNFENLSIDTTTHTTTVDDTIDTTTLSLSAASNVVEGSGSLTYTATLSNAAQGAVTVHLDNGQTITIADGDTQGTTTVAVRADDPYLDQSTLTAAITTATGGNFENLSIDTTTHTTTVDDTIDTTTLSLSAASNVVEGSGSLTYTATLSNAAQGAVTVHLDNGQTITIADGDTQGTTTVAVRADDPYLDQSTLTAAITTATGGNFENLSIDTTTHTTTVDDTIDTTTLSLSAASNVVEGSGSLTYTATLSNAAQGAVTVHLDNGQTITIADGDTQGTTTVAVRADDPYLDQSTLTAAITTATGGNFENLSIDTTTLSLSAASNVVEGSGSLTYTATLSNAAQGAVTVHLDNGQTITIADGDTQGTTTVAVRADDPYLDQSTL